MGRLKAKLHELTLREKRGRAVCWWAGRDWAFGAWDAAKGEPAPGASAAFRRQLAAWAADPAAGLRADDYLVAMMCGDWLASSDSPADGSKALVMARSTAAWLCELHGPTPAADFGPPEFRAWQDWLCRQAGPRSKKRLKRATVLRHRSNALRAVQLAVAAGRLPAGHLAALAAVPEPRADQTVPDGRRRPVSAAHVNATLPRLAPAAAAAARLMWWTGGRPEEVLTLKAGDVAKAGWVETPFDVRLNLDRFKGKVWAAVLVRHKNDRVSDRVLFFGPRAQKVLAPLLARKKAGETLFDPREARKATGRAPAYSGNSFGAAVKRAAKRAGVAHWCPRQLRQAFARRMVRKGQGERVGCCLGHAGVGVTFRYTDRDLVTAAKVYAKYG